MPKLKLPNIDDVVAIDIHTHAEEPCGTHPDDGYDDFQAQMADYFKSPHKHPPTVPETAAYYRSKNIAAVIFPVDAERETGFRRYNNYEMLEAASDHLDVLIPFVSIDPHKGKLGVREARKLIEEYGVRGFKFHPTMQGFYANDRMAYPRIRPSPGRKRRSRSRPTSRTSISTSPAGRRNIFRRFWCATSTRSCRTRCCSVRTGRSSRRTAGW